MSATAERPRSSPSPSPRPRAQWQPPERPVWEEPPTRAGLGAKGLVLAVCCVAVLGPLWVVIVTSLSPRHVIDSAGGLVLWPEAITFINYQELLGGGQVSRAMLVSVGVTGVGTVFSMGVSVLAAYGLSRPGSFAHRALLMALLTTMFFSAGLIPTYLLVQTLGLTDSYLALILPSAVSVFNILVLRGFFMNISQELTDSARIDGAGDLRILWTIVLPLSRAVVAVISLFYAVAYWSAWFNAMIYIDDPTKLPLQNVLMQLVQKNTALPTGLSQAVNAGELSALGLQMAMMVLALAPVAVASPFVQRHFKKGMLIGAVKG